ncbi:MAG: hypothetical protein GX135_03830 [Candidatus Cloacimonetes bacterium]|nr:hypothetical protein [Candidatus Cloacimonadota bacterium]
MPERIPHLRFINPSYCLPYFWQGFFLTVQESPLHHPTPNQPVILSVSDRLAGTPDSSGRRCQIHLAQCSADHPTPPTTTQTPRRPVILSASDRLVGTPDSSGRWCQIHLAQYPSDHPDSAHDHSNPPRPVISSAARNPAHAGAPDSSGRRCRIHSAQRGKHATFSTG